MLGHEPLSSSPIASTSSQNMVSLECDTGILLEVVQLSLSLDIKISSEVFSILQTDPTELAITNPNWIFSDSNIAFGVSSVHLGTILDLENINVSMMFATQTTLNNANFLPLTVNLTTNVAQSQLLVEKALGTDIELLLQSTNNLSANKPIFSSFLLTTSIISNINLPVPMETTSSLLFSSSPVALQNTFTLETILIELSNDVLFSADMTVNRSIYLHTPGYDGVYDVDVDIPGGSLDVIARMSVLKPLILEPLGGFGFDVFGDYFDSDMSPTPLVLPTTNVLVSLHVDRGLVSPPMPMVLSATSVMETKYFDVNVPLVMSLSPTSLSVDKKFSCSSISSFGILSNLEISPQIEMFVDLSMTTKVTSTLSIGIPMSSQLGISTSIQPLSLGIGLGINCNVPLSTTMVIGDLHNKSLVSTVPIILTTNGSLSVNAGFGVSSSSILSVSGDISVSRETYLSVESIKKTIALSNTVLTVGRGIYSNSTFIDLDVVATKLNKNIDVGSTVGMSFGMDTVDLFVSHSETLDCNTNVTIITNPQQMNVAIGLRSAISHNLVCGFDDDMAVDKGLTADIGISMMITANMLTRLYGAQDDFHPTGRVVKIQKEDRTLYVKREK